MENLHISDYICIYIYICNYWGYDVGLFQMILYVQRGMMIHQPVVVVVVVFVFVVVAVVVVVVVVVGFCYLFVVSC